MTSELYRKIAASRAMFYTPTTGSMMLRGPTISYAPEDDSGGGSDGDDAGQGENPKEETPKETPKEEAPKEASKEEAKTDEEKAQLLKDVMKWKEKARTAEAEAKKYEGIDPEKARKALEAQAAAERKELEAKGEYQRIIQQVADESQAKVKAAEDKVAEVQAQLEALQESIQRSDIASRFANSTFVRDSLVISGAKVQNLYGAHFDVVEGELVAYDKPRGEKDRTPLVDDKGQNLPFEAALEKVVKSDPEWERLTKANLKKGPGSTTQNLDPNNREVPKDSRSMIAKGLGSLKRKPLLGG